MGWMTGAVTRALQVVGVAGNFVQALFTQFIASGGGGGNTGLERARERSCAERNIMNLGASHHSVAGKYK